MSRSSFVNNSKAATMTPPEEDEDWILISPQSTPEHVRNEQTQTEEATDSDIDILERFDLGAAVETESIVSDFSFMRTSDLQVETCDFSDDFPDEEDVTGLNLSPRSKAYSHIPNQSVNSQLNVILIMSVAAVAGLAVGNYLGWSRSPGPDFPAYRQMMKLKQLQEELSTCKEHQVDGMNSSCLITNPAPRCDSPIISSAIITTSNLAPVSIQVRPSVALTDYVKEIPLNRDVEEKMIPNSQPKIQIHEKSNLHLGGITQEIILETRKYFPLSFDEGEKLGITVWLLLSQNGISRPLFTAGLRRLQKIKRSHLDPFTENHYPGNQYTIWPEETGISLVTADESIKNIARRSEIEKEAKDGATGRFWAKIMKKVYKRGRRFGSKSELEESITDVLLMLRQEYYGHLWNGFQKKVAKLRGRKK